MRVRSLLAAALLTVLPLPAAAQAVPPPHETSSDVPALSAMHEVVMPLWHEAWPAKDTKQMAELLPGIEKHVSAIAAVKLPGILRDKQAEWDAGVQRLQASAGGYRAAVQRKDDEALLKAAESLHMDYEKLVRVVRPATPEIDAFHQAVYVLYHYDLEKFSLPAVKEHVQGLKAKMEALQAAALPARHAAKKAAYEPARDRLAKAVDGLVAAAASGDEAKIKAGIEDVHASYEALDAVFQ
ncbi:MAG TPA: hypothetical protein VK911_13255 [Vicinamibacterales bacterium]|nr:hypothetical protein [Vicinamibacterales bacterium]